MKKDVYTLSVTVGIITALLSLLIIWLLDYFFTLQIEDHYEIQVSDILLLSVFIPVIETVILIGGVFLLELFFPLLIALPSILILVLVAHYFNHWASPLAIFPMFLISLLLFISWRSINYTKAFFGVLIIHVTHNSIIMLLDSLVRLSRM